jgi:hypothetical protein
MRRGNTGGNGRARRRAGAGLAGGQLQPAASGFLSLTLRSDDGLADGHGRLHSAVGTQTGHVQSGYRTVYSAQLRGRHHRFGTGGGPDH